jgi:hypothetical protein
LIHLEDRNRGKVVFVLEWAPHHKAK